MGIKYCPNGCGEIQCAMGQVYSNEGDTYWDVSIYYCPECSCVVDSYID